jgi:hypothetical protein
MAEKKAVPKMAVKGDLSASVDRLFNDGVLVDLQIGMWTALKRNTTSDLSIDAEDVPAFVVGLGTKRLLPPEIVKTWQTVANHARYVIERYSFVFPVGSSRFVPLSSLPRIEEELEACKQKYEAAWQALVKNYDQVRRDFLAQYPEHRSELERLFPSKEEVARKFYFDYSAYTISLPKKLRTARLDKKKQAAEEEAWHRYQQELDRRVNEFLGDAVKTLRVKAIDICTSIAESVRGGKTISTASLGALTGFIDRFKEMNFVGDTEIESRLEKLKTDILDGREPDEFKEDDALRKALASACDNVRKAAEQVSDLSSVCSGYRRKIVLD